ncbi:hypothetical protein PT2222_240011 [Paraburkholderia tropica]
MRVGAIRVDGRRMRRVFVQGIDDDVCLGAGFVYIRRAIHTLHASLRFGHGVVAGRRVLMRHRDVIHRVFDRFHAGLRVFHAIRRTFLHGRIGHARCVRRGGLRRLAFGRTRGDQLCHFAVRKLDRMLREQLLAELIRRIVERRQFFERLQAEIVEKLTRRGIKRGTSGYVAMTDDFDPVTVFELFDDLRIDGHPANLFDIAARDRLPVRDDRERLEHRARITRRLFGMQAVEVSAHGRLALKAPAGREAHQFDATPGPVVTQVFEQVTDRVGRNIVGKQFAQIADFQRLLRADQCSLEDDFRLLGIHAASSDPK